MAGDWIKVSHGLHSKPEVFGIARKLNVPIDEVVGLLVRFWVWADNNSVDGRVDHMQSTDVDSVVDRHEFGDALISVGWLLLDASGTGITIPHFDSHNGDSAKRRGLKAQAQAKWRKGLEENQGQKKSVKNVDHSVDHDVDSTRSTQRSTREEKRRSKQTPTPSLRFAEFWNLFPSNRRSDKPKCEKKWSDDKLDLEADSIIAHLRRMKATDDWTKDGGKFVPMSSTYLNQRRWDTGDIRQQNHELPGLDVPQKLSDDPFVVVGDEWLWTMRARMGGRMFIGTAKERELVEIEAKTRGWKPPNP